ncbi:MAG: 2-amino-4-hydroxy-6-hydroxymethyldihydropteridine diphosphokinase [Bacteroidetes bacterium]|nr:MAG: 2-amino-4-hydroxy-6-hydroxymethyldihydropteridine diphosphokinase [Bacteroidota bacterium]
MENRVVLLLGGNLGERSLILEQCLAQLVSQVGTIEALSGVYETEPWGFKSDVPPFWNCVVVLLTAKGAREVLARTQRIERDLGRTDKATAHYHSRTLDIDILFYNNVIYEEEDLVIPHKGIPARRFVLVPLQELMPDFVHPKLHKTITQLLGLCEDRMKVERLGNVDRARYLRALIKMGSSK